MPFGCWATALHPQSEVTPALARVDRASQAFLLIRGRSCLPPGRGAESQDDRHQHRPENADDAANLERHVHGTAIHDQRSGADKPSAERQAQSELATESRMLAVSPVRLRQGSAAEARDRAACTHASKYPPDQTGNRNRGDR